MEEVEGDSLAGERIDAAIVLEADAEGAAEAGRGLGLLQPEGSMKELLLLLYREYLLAPYLSTKELLRLGLGASWLSPFRSQVRRLKIKRPAAGVGVVAWPPHGWERGLMTLMGVQRHLEQVRFGWLDDAYKRRASTAIRNNSVLSL
jgi:hypothetical protein